MAATNNDTISSINNSLDTIEGFKDIFDIIDDDSDTFEYTIEELNKYFISGHLNSIPNEEEMIDDEVGDDINITEEIEEEAILSQNFSQLSTTSDDEEKSSVTKKRQRSYATSSSTVSSKKRKITDNDDHTDIPTNEQCQIPTYLLIQNKLFVHMAQTIIKTVRYITMNDIQKMALLMHQIATVQIDREIMKAYLHSVNGTLKEPECYLIEVDRRFWPMQVQSLMLTQHKSTTNDTDTTGISTTTTTTTPMEIDTEDQQIACENLLNQHLQLMKQQIEYYQKELDEKQSNFIRFTSIIQETIERYVQTHGIKPLEMKRDLKLVLINYDYDSEMLQREYFQEQPNPYQIEVARRLSIAKVEVEKSKQSLLELKYRVFYNKPPDSFDSMQTLTPTSNDDDPRVFDKHEKAIQSRKLHLMAIKIAEAETKFYQCLRVFDSELAAMWKNHRDLVQNQGMTTTLTNLIENRLKNITGRWREIYKYRINNYIRNSYDDLDSMNRNENDQKWKKSGFSSSLIIDATHQFTEKHLQLLNRGPTYVPPCQTSILSSCHSMDDIVERKYAPLKHQLSSLFSKHHINIALSMEIEQKISDQFTNIFSLPIVSNLQQRALYEKYLIQSIRHSLKKNNLILRRTADNKNTFYLGNLQEFEAKANDYLSKSDTYKVLLNKDKENDGQPWHAELKQMVESMNLLLESLKNHKAINIDLYNRLLGDASKVKLPCLYFLPDISKENEISLVPYITSQHSATWKIGKYLNELLRPFVDKILSSTTFRDEPDFMYQLYDYIFTKRKLQSTTLFCAITISDYYTLDVHKNMIDTVGCFLEDNLVTNKLEQVTIQTIKNLLHIFLYNNVFYYKDKMYTLTKGSPNTMPLSDTLSNIYVFVWQKEILKQLQSNNEFFGRYKDQIFFTCNNANEKQLGSFLQTIRDKNPNVQFQKSIGTNVQFFNALVENLNGELSSRIYRHPLIKRYTLPYVVGHSKLVHSDWLRSALIRAVCYCSSVEDFNLERIYLELTYLTNGYSLRFVETHVQHFFNFFHLHPMRYSRDQTMYDRFRHNWFNYIKMQHELCDQLQHFDDNGQLIHFNYVYEYGARCQFNQQFDCLWSEYFNQHPNLSIQKCKILLTTINLHSLSVLLSN